MSVIAVTGFVPNAFPARHLTLEQCRGYGERLKSALAGRIEAFDSGWAIDDCWAYDLLEANPGLMPSCADPPADRFAEPRHMTLSNIVLLQRYEWMRLAARQHPEATAFAWIEYTVLKQHNVTESVLQAFLDAVEASPPEGVVLPGCWPKGPVNDAEAHWRFVGSCWVCNRRYVQPVADAVYTVASLRARLTGKLSWDMNTMAYVELLEALPISWYPARHDDTQFTHYRP